MERRRARLAREDEARSLPRAPRIEIQEPTYKCRQCGRRFKSEKGRRIHWTRKHGGRER